jgi:uridine phosphorylase
MAPGSVDDKVLICFAMEAEAAPARRGLAGRDDVQIEVLGMGKRNAAAGIARILGEGTPRLVLTCGLAGGLREDLRLGDIVFATTDEGLASRLRGEGALPAKFHCSDRVAVSVKDKQALRDETGADAVEMESAAIQAACRARGIPCATVRAISDTCQEGLPMDFNAMMKPDTSLDLGKLVRGIMHAPHRIPSLLRLRRRSMRAAVGLSTSLLCLLAGAARKR